MAVKLTLDAEALTLLFNTMGPEFKLQIRQAALEECAKRTIKQAVEPEARKMMDKVSKAIVKEALGEQDYMGAHLSKEFRERIGRQVRAATEQMVIEALNPKQIVAQALERAEEMMKTATTTLEGEIALKVIAQMNINIGAYINQQVKDGIATLMKGSNDT